MTFTDVVSCRWANFPVTVSWEDCPFLFAHSWFDFHELTTYMWVHSWALYSFLESMCLCSCQFLTVVVTTASWCSLKSERMMPPAVFFFLRVFLAIKGPVQYSVQFSSVQSLSRVRVFATPWIDMLSRLVITFLPRSKRLLISWLQSPSAVILEPPPQ